MDVRDIQKLGIRVSRLGFGAMRLPVKEGKIDFEQAKDMVDYCLSQGVNYFDTAYMYHNSQSEPFLGEALVKRHPRDRYFVASKLPLDFCKTPADMERIFEKQRENLGVETIDFYLLHGIGEKQWAHGQELGAPEFLRRLKKECKIRFGGFSFHGAEGELQPIADANDWDFCQIQVNYADWLQRGSKTIYDVLSERGIPIIVMEPVRGGGLTNLPPESVALLKKMDPNRSLASWAIRFVASLPNVDIILSGMSSMDQCEDNVKTLSGFTPLTQENQDVLAEVAEEFTRRPLVPCTQCRYCDGCPQGIDIATIFSYFNNYTQFQDTWPLRQFYYRETPPERQATACVRCAYCRRRCPQGIEIPTEIRRAHAVAQELAQA